MDETVHRDGAGRFIGPDGAFVDPPAGSRPPTARAGRFIGPGGLFVDPPGSGVAVDRALSSLALAQHGVFTASQLTAVGLSTGAARRRCARGALHRIHHGVYSLVPRELLKLNGLRMAAVLAFGEEAALSHRSAGALLGLVRAEAGPFEVSVASRAGRPQRPGLRIHRTATLRPEDITVIDGVRCTSVARTLIDLAERELPRGLERALDQAEALGRLDLEELREQIEHNHGRLAATARLRRALAVHVPGTTATWNEIEERFLALIRQAGLVKPEVQAYLDLQDGEPMIQPDFLWRAQRVIVETDGWQHHGTRRSFEADRRRDQRATAAGFRTLRVTWRQIQSEPGRLQRTVASAVSAGAAAGMAA